MKTTHAGRCGMALTAGAVCAMAAAAAEVTFEKKTLSDQFVAEGACCADFNRDGRMDVVAGPWWFEGPDFTKRHEIREVKTFDPLNYSDNFLTFSADFNRDGWPDVLAVPFPGAEGYWHENPAGRAEPWKKHLVHRTVDNESPMLADIHGDGTPELIMNAEGKFGYVAPDPARPTEPWPFTALTPTGGYHKFTHGIGVGDINGDGRPDLIGGEAWWEQPAEWKPGVLFVKHPFKFAEAAAQMLVTDVDGDKLADVITAWHCHQYGMLWWKQTRDDKGAVGFIQQVILPPQPDMNSPDLRISQMHALSLADVNRDGLPDLLTGKRFWAHGPKGDVEADKPPVLYWFELQRGPGGARFIPHRIDDQSGVGMQVETGDLNGDAHPDPVICNKKGIFVFLSRAPGK